MFGQEDVLSGIQLWPNANRTSEHFVHICDQGHSQCSEPVCLRFQATVAFDSCALFTTHSSVHCCRLVSKSKKSEQILFFSFFEMIIFNEQGSFRGSINLGIEGQRVWVPFYQPLVTDCQRSLFNEKGTWRLWVQGSQRNVLKPHKRAEERMDGDEMGDWETDDIFNFSSM